ncbi:MAG: penicillin-binding protein, partial [Alphaproteobacteria bacterium]
MAGSSGGADRGRRTQLRAPARRAPSGPSKGGGRKPARKPRRSGGSGGGRKPVRRGPLRRLFGWLLRALWAVGWRAAAVGAILLAGAVAYDYSRLPPAAEMLADGRVRGSVTLLDKDGRPFAWRGEQFGGVITADTVSPHLKHAIVATEDRRFYRHFGIDPRGILRAMIVNIRAGRGPFSGQGGSTITQQLAKLLCLGRRYDPASGISEAAFEADCRQTTLWRKIKEVPYALALELRYSKDEILSVYMNRAYLGAGTKGFEAAAQRYFGKSARNLTPAEAAMLAGLLKAPSYYAPTRNLERARGRAAVILGLMRDQGYLTEAEYRDALAHPAQLSAEAMRRAGGWFADWVMEAGPAFLTRRTTEDVIIRTTFD